MTGGMTYTSRLATMLFLNFQREQAEANRRHELQMAQLLMQSGAGRSLPSMALPTHLSAPGIRLLARILKVGVQMLCGPKAHIAWCRRRHAARGVWGHAPPENFEKLKPLRRDFRDSDSCKRLSIYLLNRCFSLIILLIYPSLNLPCLRLNYIWDRNSSCYEE